MQTLKRNIFVCKEKRNMCCLLLHKPSDTTATDTKYTEVKLKEILFFTENKHLLRRNVRIYPGKSSTRFNCTSSIGGYGKHYQVSYRVDINAGSLVFLWEIMDGKMACSSLPWVMANTSIASHLANPYRDYHSHRHICDIKYCRRSRSQIKKRETCALKLNVK